jgi:predicted ATPase
MREETRRLITLIDELYEGRVALLVAAEGEPTALFAAAAAPPPPAGEEDGVPSVAAAEAAAVGELRVACKRAASRLMEVRAWRWWWR